jgi:uncharacterized RDD family membrane protein YckC
MADWKPWGEVQAARAQPPVAPAPSPYPSVQPAQHSQGIEEATDSTPTAPAYSPQRAYSAQAPTPETAPQTTPQQSPYFPSGIPSPPGSPAYQGQPGGPVPAFAGAIPCSTCRRPFPHEDLLILFNKALCPVCKPIYIQRIQEGLESISKTKFGERAYATFGKRFVAKILDICFLMVVGFIQMPFLSLFNQTDMVLQMIVTGVSWLIGIAIGAGYTTFFLGRYQATPGKMIMKIKVIRSDGSRISYWRALGRHFAEFISQIFLYLGYIVAAFDEERRTWHDRIVDSRVVDKDAV